MALNMCINANMGQNMQKKRSLKNMPTRRPPATVIDNRVNTSVMELVKSTEKWEKLPTNMGNSGFAGQI